MTSSLIDRCQHFCGTWCLHFQLLAQNRGSTFLKNDGTCLQNYTQSYHKASTSIPTAVRTLNNPLHRVFLSLQDTVYLEYNYKIGSALYTTLLSCQFGHNLRAYYKTVLKIKHKCENTGSKCTHHATVAVLGSWSCQQLVSYREHDCSTCHWTVCASGACCPKTCQLHPRLCKHTAH